jgi:hypothetical protein
MKHKYNYNYNWKDIIDRNFAEIERMIEVKIEEAVEELRREGRLPPNDCGDREGIGEEV